MSIIEPGSFKDIGSELLHLNLYKLISKLGWSRNKRKFKNIRLVSFSRSYPTKQNLNQLNYLKFIPQRQLNRLAIKFEEFEQLLSSQAEPELIKECIRSISARYDTVSQSAYNKIDSFKEKNPSRTLEVASTIELHFVYADRWCKYMQNSNDVYSELKRADNLAKAETAKFLRSAIYREEERLKSSHDDDNRTINISFGCLVAVTVFLSYYPFGIQEEAPLIILFTTVLLLIKNNFGIFNTKLSKSDRETMRYRAISRRYNKLYECSNRELLNYLGFIQSND